jgi:hypothetical protein
MPTEQVSRYEPLPLERWLRILSDYRQSLWPGAHVRERRRRKRVQIHAMTTVEFKAPGSEKITTYRNCPVLDASNDSLAVTVYYKIPLGTRLTLALSMGGKHYLLFGAVAANSGFPGAVRVGIILNFPDAEQSPSNAATEPGR